jgi:hypothetical protein
VGNDREMNSRQINLLQGAQHSVHDLPLALIWD